MAKTTPTPKTDESPLTYNEAVMLTGKNVHIEGVYLGAPYQYDGKVIAAHLPGKPSLELVGLGIGPGGIPNGKKSGYSIFVPIRSILHCNERG